MVPIDACGPYVEDGSNAFGRMRAMNRSNDANAVITNRRTIVANPREIFAAMADPAMLARWWGPEGFTNTFETFEFRPEGRWVFVMHGPNGIDYTNECVFREILPDSKVVLEHVLPPIFQLSVTLVGEGDRTHLLWEQEFESVTVADSVRAICEPANEQNLDRLEVVLSETKG